MSMTEEKRAEGASPSAAQVEALLREVEAMKAALARGRAMRSVLFLVALGGVVFGAYKFYELGDRLKQPEYHQALQRHAQKRLEDNREQYLRELQLLTSSVTPVISNAFAERAKADMPTYMDVLVRERDTFGENVRTQLFQRLDLHYNKAIDRHMDLIAGEIPSIKDPERQKLVTGHMHLAMQKLVKKYHIDDVRDQFVALYDAWDQFPAAPAPKPGESRSEDLIMGILVDLLSYKLTH